MQGQEEFLIARPTVLTARPRRPRVVTHAPMRSAARRSPSREGTVEASRREEADVCWAASAVAEQC